MVLIHSSSLTTEDAAFARGISQTAAGFAALPVVDHLRAPGRGDDTGLVSKDRHSALITFTIKGDAATASNRIAPVVAAVKDAQQSNPALRIEEFGDATSGAQLDKKVQSDLHKAETMSLSPKTGFAPSPSVKPNAGCRFEGANPTGDSTLACSIRRSVSSRNTITISDRPSPAKSFLSATASGSPPTRYARRSCARACGSRGATESAT